MWQRHLRRAVASRPWPGLRAVVPHRGAAGAAAAPVAPWEPEVLRALLQQAAQEGRLERPLLRRLRGEPPPAAAAAAPDPEASGEEGSGEGEAGAVVVATEEASLEACSGEDLLLTAEACLSRRYRDCVLLSALATRLAPNMAQAPTSTLRRAGSAFAAMGVLHPPLFQGLAQAWLQVWQTSAEPSNMTELTEVARCFAAQRMRHEQLFDALGAQLALAGGAAAATPAEALSILHSHAFLRLGAELGDARWRELEEKAKSDGLSGMGRGPLAELCYVLALSRQADSRQEDLCEMLAALAPAVLSASEEFWASGEGAALHMRVLLLRSVMRYVYKDAYKALPGDVVQAFRKVHRMELPRKTLKPAVAFVRKLSENLRKMKIGHIVHAEHGPFVFDAVERDRKIIYDCLHFDRYYAGTVEKIETMCLQERVAKAMGYRVIQVPHWQWNKIKHRRQRAEYLRMARYYAIKDGREFAPRDDVPTDVALNAFDYMGEYFFRKERPSSAWSWFQPRYDYTRRLPPPAS